MALSKPAGGKGSGYMDLIRAPGAKVIAVHDKVHPKLKDDQVVEKALQYNATTLEHGLMALDKQVNIVGDIVNLSEGRDKIFKIFSGVLKLIKWVLEKYYPMTANTKDILTRINGCSKATSTARAFLKLFTDWVFFRLTAKVFQQQRFGILKVLTLIKLGGLALYFTFAIPVWLQTVSLVPSINKDYWNKASLIALIFSLTCQVKFILDFKKLKELSAEIGYLKAFSTRPTPALVDPEDAAAVAAEVAALPPTRFESHSALQAYEHALLKTNFPIREESSSSSSSSASASAPSASSSSSSSSAAAPAQEQQEEEEEEKKEVSAAAASLPPASSSASHALRRGSSGGLSYAGYAPSTNSSGGAAVGLRANVRNVMTAYETAVKDVQEATEKVNTKVTNMHNEAVNLAINFVKDGGDFFGALNVIFDWGFSDLTNGLLGVQSGGISLWRLWTRASKALEEKKRLEAAAAKAAAAGSANKKKD